MLLRFLNFDQIGFMIIQGVSENTDTFLSFPALVFITSRTRVSGWWQKVVLTTGFYWLKPAGKKCGWQKMAKKKISLIIKSFLILVKTKPDM